MGEHVIKLPDVGEGVAEAELVEWHVEVGDHVQEDALLVAVMTDKATVEVPSPVAGTVLWLAGDVGDTVSVGAPLVRLGVDGEGNITEAAAARVVTTAEPEPPPPEPEPTPEATPTAVPTARPAPRSASPSAYAGAPRRDGQKPIAAPAVRQRAREAGADLRMVRGTGPAGRITHEDLDQFLERGSAAAPATGLVADTSVREIKVVGLRRRIAERMALAKSRIAHITYVDEVDMTALEELRASLNRGRREDQPRLTLLPFLVRALVRAIAEQPNLNAHYDDDAGVIRQHGGVHVGIATQTPAGLVVPVLKHAEARDLWDCAAEIVRLAEVARAGTATRAELSGSTITITSLGAMGGLVSTPVINHPEVAIIGVNKMQMRPVWDGAQFVPRKMMNLSSSFDHRVIDGWDAAGFVQRIKSLLETPATIFIQG